MLPIRAIVLSLLAVVVAACSSETSTQPVAPGGITAPKDSAPGSFYAGVSDLSGKVILHTPSTGHPDSVIVAPAGSALIKLSRNDKSDGSGPYSYVTEVTPGADGGYSFKGLPAGFYLMATTVQVGLWTGFQITYVPANMAAVTVDIHVYRN